MTRTEKRVPSRRGFARPNAIPIVNVVATFVVLVSIIPVYIAQRLIDEPVEPGSAVT